MPAPRMPSGRGTKSAASGVLLVFPWRKSLTFLFGLICAAACTISGNHETERISVSILAFGDSGLHPKYTERKYFEHPYRTPAAFEDFYKSWWRETGRPVDDFTLPPLEYHEPSGSYIPKTGLFAVAGAMTESCERVHCDFAVMLGDNIYPDGATLGADGVDDAIRFDDLFSVPFAQLGKSNPDFRIYTTLGNHDWHTSREGALAQLDFMERDDKFYMDGLFYSVAPPAGRGDVELFVVDTEMLLAMTAVRHAWRNEDGSEKKHDVLVEPRASAIPRTEAERGMVEWLTRVLAASGARWKIVIGHHPMWSAGGAKFEQARAIRRLLRAAVCKYADAYVAGHEHTLEVYSDSCDDAPDRTKTRPLIHVVSGAAAKQRSVHAPYLREQNDAYPQRRTLFAAGMIWGFARLGLRNDEMTVELYTTAGRNGDALRVFSETF